ncbi:hypothetical protein [Anaerobranca gottschalkii]|uniref:Uncharacterized protein n=1 Tax=Anaerobranca gottschalkii DSM 13577 TaxID=1120990 RepID=A0A1I0AKT8_9FIRM|nr:hypothetical protein [Anaerobranca gottschalkii]SES94476.1 hypothetical protein SAMN03080614_10232 [Anaerobranca gottschalkii DSM 13577]
MEKVSLFNFIFSMIPRSLVAIYFCQSLLLFRVSTTKFMLMSFLFACVTWLTRAYFPIGFHSFVAMLFLVFVLNGFAKVKINSAFITAIIYFTLLYIFDFFVLYIYNFFTNLSLYEIWLLEVTRVLLTIPASIAFLAISYYCRNKPYNFDEVIY